MKSGWRFQSTEGAARCQPRATPWVHGINQQVALKGRPNRRDTARITKDWAALSGLELGSEPVTQGDALGWYKAGALPLRNGTVQHPIAALDAESAEVLQTIRRSLSAIEEGRLI